MPPRQTSRRSMDGLTGLKGDNPHSRGELPSIVPSRNYFLFSAYLPLAISLLSLALKVTSMSLPKCPTSPYR